MKTTSKAICCEEPIHNYFELSYSNYLLLQRSILQSMPLNWQKKFTECLYELNDKARNLKDQPYTYEIIAKDKHGNTITDPYSNYERGRRVIKLDK